MAEADRDGRWLEAYLHYGYRPWGGVPVPGPWEVDKTARRAELARLSEAELIDEGVRVLKTSLGNCEAADHVVPLSGGLDSRAILGALLETVGPSQIRTVTFGTPGTLDFELGRAVAQAAGVRWEGFDLRTVSWQTADLVEFAAGKGRPLRVFEAFLNGLLRRYVRPESVVWNGFIGGPLGGCFQLEEPSRTWAVARQRFAKRATKYRPMPLTPPGYDPEADLPASALLEPRCLSYDDQMAIFINQAGWILPVLCLEGCDFRIPFANPAWATFMLSIPDQHRYHKSLYKKVLKAAFPQLLALPIKEHRGLPVRVGAWEVKLRRLAIKLWKAPRRVIPAWPWGADPMLNYLDFARAVRERADLRRVVDENLHDLARRKLVDWLDVRRIWARHRRGHANCFDAVEMLTTLEILLKAQERRPWNGAARHWMHPATSTNGDACRRGAPGR